MKTNFSSCLLFSGQKGIGFKSVFRVTDQPQVHSNGFHIKFDASSGPNGYILPQWVDKENYDMSYDIPSESEQNKVYVFTSTLSLFLL